MKNLTREELKNLRDTKKKELSMKYADTKKIKIVIGLGSCGIAAGAKETWNAFLDEIERQDLRNVEISQTGCMGTCSFEPTVEIIMPDMPPIIYGKVDEEVARKIVQKHIINQKLLSNHIQDNPSKDITE